MRARSLRESEGKNPEIRALADCVADAEEDYATCYGMLHAGEQHGVRQVVLAEFMTCRQDTRTEDDSMTDMIDVNDDDEHAPINHVLPSARKLMQVCIGEHRDEVKDQGTLQDLRMLRARLLG